MYANVSKQEKQSPKIRRIGRLMIMAGVLVWLPYVALKLADGDPEVMYFLPFHLAGVIPGSIMSRWHQLKRLIRR